MEQNTRTSVNIIQSLDDLKVLAFWRIIKESNFYYLDNDYYKGKEYSETDQEQIRNSWLQLYDEYYTLCNDGKSKNELKRDVQELYLAYKIHRLDKSLELLKWLTKQEFILGIEMYMKLLTENINMFYDIDKSLKGKLNIFDIDKSVNAVEKYMLALTNQHNKIISDKPKKVDEKVKNIFERVAAVGLALGIQLNVNEMTVSEWIAWQQMARKKSENNSRNIKKGKR